MGTAKAASAGFCAAAQVLQDIYTLVLYGPTALHLYVQHTGLGDCSNEPLSAKWTRTCEEDSWFLILLPNPDGAATLAQPPPAGLGPNPEATMLHALQAAGAMPVGDGPSNCFRFNDCNALDTVCTQWLGLADACMPC